mgnify:FL=1
MDKKRRNRFLIALACMALVIGVFALMFALQVLVVQFGGAMFRTVPLPIDMWLKIIAVGQMRG